MTDKQQDILERLKAQFFGMYDESNLTADEVVVADAIAEIERLRKPWKPIAELPYDEVVILRWEDGSIAGGFWYDEPLASYVATMKKRPNWAGDEAVPLTHWMPLPTPPETEDG